MAEFLTTAGTSYHIEKIIRESRKKLVLISPYLQLSKTLYERLKDASNNGILITIIFGKDQLKPNESNSLASLKNVTLYFFQNLHAKCYYNESKMVITSMNMYEFSEKTNREMGVLIDSVADKDVFREAVLETSSIIKHSEIIQLKRIERRYFEESATSNNKKSTPQMGYCIRCEIRIPSNILKPYCTDCFIIWSQFENRQYEENVCHSCGEFNEASMEKPLCYNCFKNR